MKGATYATVRPCTAQVTGNNYLSQSINQNKPIKYFSFYSPGNGYNIVKGKSYSFSNVLKFGSDMI